MRKAAELRPVEALAILKEGRYGGMTYSSAVNGFVKGYVKSSDSEVNWLELIKDVKGITGASGTSFVDGYGTVARTVALEWAKEDLRASLDWFTRETGRELSDPKYVGQITSVLGGLPAEEKFQAIDWIGEQRDRPEWNDQLALKYGKTLALKKTPLDPDVDRLVGFVNNEDLRYEFVSNFLKPAKSGKGLELRYDRVSLNRLIESARLPVERSESLQKQMASVK